MIFFIILHQTSKKYNEKIWHLSYLFIHEKLTVFCLKWGKGILTVAFFVREC